uniref:Cyclin D1 n=1 Tax=Labrus bergylta TaxID=56723 RepID=A0A3Q3EJ84_9LABR
DITVCLPADVTVCLPAADVTDCLPAADATDCLPAEFTVCLPAADVTVCLPADVTVCLPAADVTDCLPAADVTDCLPAADITVCLPADITVCLPQMELMVLNKLKWTWPLRENRPILRKHAQTFVALCATDVKFIASPPSMVAAGSMVAAVEGLQMRMVGNSSMYEKLTAGLSPSVSEQIESLLETSLRQAQQQQHSVAMETKSSDVRDVNI